MLAVIFLSFITTIGWSQFTERFDLDLSSWSGDIDDFIINENHQLQLQAPEDGASYLYTTVKYPEEFVIECYMLLDFSPSDNNKSRIYIYSTHADPDQGEGYFLEFGENGANDAISIFSFSGEQTSLIGRGIMGAIASDPVELRWKLTRFSDGFWTMDTDYGNSGFYEVEMEFRDESVAITEGYFGIFTQYTSSRISAFYFDDIYISEYEEDITPPSVVEASIVNPTQISIIFDELLSSFPGENLDNYFLTPGNVQPNQVSINRNTIFLEFENELISGPFYQLTIGEITDLNGNAINNTVIEGLFLAIPPEAGDVVINEIMFNPFPGDEDFIELYNRSEKIINLKNSFIENKDRDERTSIVENILLFPDDYVAISEDPQALINRYQPPSTAYITSGKLPAFNNDEGNIILYYLLDVIDQIQYHEDMHAAIINDNEGVSLERINAHGNSLDENNWTSGVSTTLFATPGYSNSTKITGIPSEAKIALRKKTFSPDGDGNDDLLVIDFQLEQPGYVANIQIFSDIGHKVYTLANNRSIPVEGFITWDGVTDDGNIGQVGPYILVIELFHPDGSILNEKFACILAKPF